MPVVTVSSGSVIVGPSQGAVIKTPGTVASSTSKVANQVAFKSGSSDVIAGAAPRGIQGLDAYELAVLEGYVGTRAEWIESLHGTSAVGAYLHEQLGSSTVWDIDHRLGYDPAAIRVLDQDGDTWMITDPQYLTPGQMLRIVFPVSITGTARLS